MTVFLTFESFLNNFLYVRELTLMDENAKYKFIQIITFYKI